MAAPFAVDRDSGERLEFWGTRIVVRASADTTGGAFTLFELGTPLLDATRHVHRETDELYHVLEGEHVFVCGDAEFTVGPGGTVFLPHGVPHSHRRVVPWTRRLLGMTSAGGGYRPGMPKTTKSGKAKQDEIPSTLQRSDEKAQRTFAKTHDSAMDSYDDERRANQTPQAEGGRDTDRETKGGVDANATKDHLMDVAKRLDISGRSRMTKDELVDAIQKANDKATAEARKKS